MMLPPWLLAATDNFNRLLLLFDAEIGKLDLLRLQVLVCLLNSEHPQPPALVLVHEAHMSNLDKAFNELEVVLYSEAYVLRPNLHLHGVLAISVDPF